MRRRPHPGFWDHRQRLSGADPGGGDLHLSESVGRSIDFYSGLKKTQGGGAIRNPKKSRYRLL